MATEDNADVEALNQGLNTPVDDDDNPPGYGESEEVEEAPEETEEVAEETAEATEETTAKGRQEEEEEDDPKPLSRGQQRIQALANEKKLAEQRAALLERQLEMVRQERAQQAQRPQEEENLTDLEKWQRQADATIRQVQFQNLDMQDRSDFLTQVSKNPAEAAYIERVEQTLVEARNSGFNPKREDVLIRLMGLDARSKVKAAPAVKREAAQRVTAAKGKPLAAKSNVAATKTESTEFDRLKGIIL
jgi:hypothetical protein